jgi:lipoprotein-anchoring transpeptidase ErfK/SrfK
MRFTLLSAALPLCLMMAAACTYSEDSEENSEAPVEAAVDDGADSMAARDPAPGQAAKIDIPDAEQRPLMQAQVVLERLGFGPGVIDGKQGLSFTNAVMGFQESRDLPVTGELDDATREALSPWSNITATRVVTIPADWGQEQFAALPDGMAEQAKVSQLGYENMAEKLAERFHTTPAVLAQLNPGGKPAGADGAVLTSASPSPDAAVPQFVAGQQLRVPNTGADAIDAASVDNEDWLATLRSLGVGTDQPEVARILVDESEGWLKAHDGDDRLVAMFTVTTGSQQDPLPIGDWKVKGVAYNPPFAFDPELFWDVPDSAEKQQLPPGPNGPVGVVWIDLTKEHYGIHGTPAPENIGRTESHGCVRLTNWDAARLAVMVGGSTAVEFRR